MIRSHLNTILWLKWRLSLNQLKRRSALGRVLAILVLITSVATAIMAFVVALGLGVKLLPEARPDDILFLWDAIVVIFVLFWIIGVVTELQRSESLSFEKLLHLPVSLRGAFLLNYAGSFLAFSLIVFAPGMFGLSLALVYVEGPRLLIVLPLVLTFLLMITAITYQFRGWLAALMANKRRRGTIVVTVTLVFIALTQLPQLFFFMRSDEVHTDSRWEELERQHEDGIIDRRQLNEQRMALTREAEMARQAEEQETLDKLLRVNLFVPAGWLPYGTRAAIRGDLWPGVLGSLGALTIAGLCLGQSYRTTMRLYTRGGRTRRRPEKNAAKIASVDAVSSPRAELLERSLPGCSEQSAAIALASFRSLTRSPQAKMLLITPVIMLMLFGSTLMINRQSEPPEELRPLLGIGAVVIAMFCIVQLLQNAFGFDRDGFRALVLSAVPRHEILLGKNLSVAPIAFTVGGIGLAALQIAFPLRVSHLIASLLQLLSIYMICCMIGNLVSIITPMAMSATTLKPAQPKLTAIVKQMVFTLLFPIAIVPTLIPLGLEFGLEAIGRRAGIPVYLILSIVELILVAWIYRHAVRAQGRFLQHRERHILDEVTRPAA